jgi:regulator of sigma E protease
MTRPSEDNRLMDTLGSILLYGGSFILTLSLVVFVHELGHFQAARWSKVSIEAFSIGFGKALLSWKDKQGVQWRISALPLGGYVKFTGDADVASTGPDEAYDTPERLAEARKKGLLHAMPVGVRAFVAVAGPAMNFIFAILAFALLGLILGRDVTQQDALSPRVTAIQEGSAANAAGMLPGDLVLSVDGQGVGTFGELRAIISASSGKELTLLIDREGSIVTVALTPRPVQMIDPQTGIESTVGRAGIMRPPTADEVVIDRMNPIEALGYGAQQTWGVVTGTFSYISNIIKGLASAEHISGPTGILMASGQVAEGALGHGGDVGLGQRLINLALTLIGWAAFLSVSVGIVNLLPVPVLDGGHLAFYAIEAARGGKPLPAQVQEWAVRGGLLCILGLFLFATFNDIRRIVAG